MATFREITYMVLDLLKEHSDDAFYTEEHVMFLIGKMRALLLERKYKQTRNSAFREMSKENLQKICLKVEPTTVLPAGCGGLWLKSDEVIPDTIAGTQLRMFVANGLVFTPLTFIPPERMPYIGYNKWLNNIVYASKSSTGYLYIKGNNDQYKYLERVEGEGVFTDPEKAAMLASCDINCERDNCAGEVTAEDILDMEYPLEASLIPACIEMVVQELSGARFAPEDKSNNAKDDLGDVAVARTGSPNVARRQAQEAEEVQQ